MMEEYDYVPELKSEQELEDDAYWAEVARLENLAPQDHDEQAFIDAYLGNQDRRGDR